MSLNILGSMALEVNKIAAGRTESDGGITGRKVVPTSLGAKTSTVYSSDRSTGGQIPLPMEKTGTESSMGDTRVRLKAQTPDVYGNGIMAILKETNGMLFPYTPSIQVSHDVNYSALAMTHANTDYHSYTNTPNVTINVTGRFSVQNAREGRYALAALHFLRTASKMYFGEKDAENGLAGLPPPVLLLNGYGTYMFNDLKVILRNHSYSFDENVDTVVVNLANGTARLPALFTISLSLVAQQTPQAMRKDFSLEDFRSGALMERGGWL